MVEEDHREVEALVAVVVGVVVEEDVMAAVEGTLCQRLYRTLFKRISLIIIMIVSGEEEEDFHLVDGVDFHRVDVVVVAEEGMTNFLG